MSRIYIIIYIHTSILHHKSYIVTFAPVFRHILPTWHHSVLFIHHQEKESPLMTKPPGLEDVEGIPWAESGMNPRKVRQIFADKTNPITMKGSVLTCLL